MRNNSNISVRFNMNDLSLKLSIVHIHRKCQTALTGTIKTLQDYREKETGTIETSQKLAELEIDKMCGLATAELEDEV